MLITIDTSIPIGKQIKRLARKKKVPIYKLCQAAGITPQTFSHWIKENPESIKAMFLLLESVTEAKDKNFERRRII
jgi:transcriptional regulator with XRE-family HTH domain